MRLATVFLAMLALAACSSVTDDPTEPGPIQPGDAGAVSAALVLDGSTRVAGTPPAPSTADDAPSVSDGAPDVEIGPGGVVTLTFAVRSAEALAGYYVAVGGAGDYFDIQTAPTGQLGQVRFTLPTGIAAGSFPFAYCVYNGAGQVSNVLTTTVRIVAGGPAAAQGGATAPPTGTPGGTIAWNTTAVPVRGEPGRRFSYDCPAGGPPRTVWGTDLYTDDSSICTAAVHAGRFTVAAGGSVTIETREGASAYPGSTRNGITTSNWGSWGASFVVAE